MGPWLLTLIFFAVSLLCCCMGFKKFVWFLSIGYGFSVVGLGVAYAVYGFISGNFDIFSLLACVLFVVYGLRLSLFLAIREFKNASYRKVLKEATKEDEKKMPVFVLATMWLMVGFLYFMQTSPVFYRMYNGLDIATFGTGIICPIIGLVISCIGVLCEALADKQKSAQKKENPNMVATKGLFRMVRCPNYFGEILFWTGTFISGCQAMNKWWMWVVSAIGYVCIVYIMFNGAQRLDKRQEGRYGKSEEYRAYADHTPIIIPLLPIYHLGDYKNEKPKKEKK